MVFLNEIAKSEFLFSEFLSLVLAYRPPPLDFENGYVAGCLMLYIYGHSWVCPVCFGEHRLENSAQGLCNLKCYMYVR